MVRANRFARIALRIARVTKLGSHGPGNCAKRENLQKWLREGAKGLLDPARKKPPAPVQNGVTPVQKGFLVVQRTLGRPLLPMSKRPFAPSPNYFWRFSLTGNFPGPWLPKSDSARIRKVKVNVLPVRGAKELDRQVIICGRLVVHLAVCPFSWRCFFRIWIWPPTRTSVDSPSDAGCGRSESLLLLTKEKPGFPQ